MIVKHLVTTTRKEKDSTGKEIEKTSTDPVDITNLINKITWGGSRQQASRKLIFNISQDARDTNLPVHAIGLGETVQGYDEAGNMVFQGNVYTLEKDVQASSVSVTCYDNLFVLCRSKTTRKFTDVLAEDVASSICNEMGIKIGNLAKTGKSVKFIASRKSGFQIIMLAYQEAAKQINKNKAETEKIVYFPVMNGDKLDVVEKGSLVKDYVATDLSNIENAKYKESIENMVNKVMITDQQGNVTGYKTNDEWTKKYATTIQDVYKTSPKADTDNNVKELLKKPEMSGVLDLHGDYGVKASYSIKVQSSLFPGDWKFYVKSDTHSFENGMHFMKVELEFENKMEEEKA